MANGNQRLLERALSLPIATRADFANATRIPTSAPPELLRIIKDTPLRARLINAGLAEGLQSPKGPQRIASIIRVYPSADAPPPQRRSNLKPKPAASANAESRARRNNHTRASNNLPTVEELNDLMNRLMTEEERLRRTTHDRLEHEIHVLKHAVATSENTDLDRSLTELTRALAERRRIDETIRETAFATIEADTSFSPRRFLRIVSPKKSNPSTLA